MKILTYLLAIYLIISILLAINLLYYVYKPEPELNLIKQEFTGVFPKVN